MTVSRKMKECDYCGKPIRASVSYYGVTRPRTGKGVRVPFCTVQCRAKWRELASSSREPLTPPPLGPGSPDAPKLNPLIEFLEAQASELADEWTFDGTSFEQDQHTRAAALNLMSAALHLRSLRAHAVKSKGKS